MERSWIDVYASTDIERAQKNGYKILEYKEIWHYKQGGGKIFRDFILNIVKRKIECSGFPVDYNTPEAKQKYVDTLKEQCSFDIKVEDIQKDPAGRYLNKIMANSMWGKWVQNPGSQSSIYLCVILYVIIMINC